VFYYFPVVCKRPALGIEFQSAMPSRLQAGLAKRNADDESAGLMFPPPTLSTPSIKSAFSTTHSMSSHEAPLRKTPQLVTWGINWKEPALMITFAMCGLTGAIGHHLYYHFMDKTLVSSPATQQWALRFGTAFSVFTITMLRAAIVAAYNQYIWKAFRDKSFSVSDMDKIFALTSDFTGFFSLALIKCGRLVILLASLCW
jgi:hypothetical protein